MFDTVTIARSLDSFPNPRFLEQNGFRVHYSQYTGEPHKFVLKPFEQEVSPSLCFYRSRQHYWILSANVSVGRWLNGSNSILPNDADIPKFYRLLSDFVGARTGIDFNPEAGRVTRVDFTRDFLLSASATRAVITGLRHHQIPKYYNCPYGESTVYFKSCGRGSPKQLVVYDKSLEQHSFPGQDRRVLRVEVVHRRSKTVRNLAQSLGARTHLAANILTQHASNVVIEQAMQKLHLAELMKEPEPALQILAGNCDPLTAHRLAGHLLFKKLFGPSYAALLFPGLSSRTIRQYARDCARLGISFLE